MIKLLNENSQIIETFESGGQLIEFLRENWRNLNESERESWRFVTYPYKLLARVLRELKDKSFADMAQEACQSEKNMVVMCIGDANSPYLFLDTPDLDIDELWAQWCVHYCKAYGLDIVVE